MKFTIRSLMTVVAGFALVFAFVVWMPRFAWLSSMLVFLQVSPAVAFGTWSSVQKQKRQGLPVTRSAILGDVMVFLFVSLGVWVLLMSLLFVLIYAR